ncbi:hypothetical protein NDU88_003226 [Pleurodeles waltl]|uniref:Uncharacterized protein n=1 Tax=Pleurodeles waltl TaxID=8319 RepID=A0AAV7Q8D3_PLEWA|nr:hypothetical protein NDU88_003226 [Pleurodeles waltl]
MAGSARGAGRTPPVLPSGCCDGIGCGDGPGLLARAGHWMHAGLGLMMPSVGLRALKVGTWCGEHGSSPGRKAAAADYEGRTVSSPPR